jgi:dTDP-4-dehydrorhamnose 3,5-epimerase
VRTELPEVLVIEPRVFRDPRGFLIETYHAERYRRLGIERTFVQDNYSRSVAGTLRGLHLQVSSPQAKLVRVVAGAIYDVAVDVRRGSPTFAHWVAVELSADNFKQCYIPEGFAHGFAVLTPHADIEYKCTALYDPASEVGIAWDDPAIGITWPLDRPPVLSERDRTHPILAAQMDRLPVYQPDSRHNR